MKGFSTGTVGAVCLLLVVSLASTSALGAAGGGGLVAADSDVGVRGEAAVKVPAVPLNGQAPAGGLPTVIHVKVTPGDGDVFMETEPLSEPDFQVAARNAVLAAANATDANVSNVDVFFSVEAPLASIVEGPSAGAAMAVATAAALQGEDVRSDVAITGTVLPGGSIGTVGALDDKAAAAAESGASTFIVPTASSTPTPGVPAVRLGPGVLVLSMPEEAPNLSKIEASHDIRMVEVGTVAEALEVAVTPGLGSDAHADDSDDAASQGDESGGALAFKVPGPSVVGALGAMATAAAVAVFAGMGRRDRGRGR